MEEERSAFKIVISTPAGKMFLGTPSCRWEDNITMDLKEIGTNARNWVDSAQESPCEYGVEPPGSISYGVSSS